MNFTVIDFETANSKRASACSIGIVKVADGVCVLEKEWLIKPPTMDFNWRNIQIHGIRPEDVMYAPTFDELYKKELKQILEGALIVAHNASFDISVLRHMLDYYQIDYPTFDYLCTVKISQKTWRQLSSHRLNLVSDYLGFDFKHHNALEDCLACSNLLVSACIEKKSKTPLALANHLKIGVGKLYPKGYKPCSINRY
ncbi:MAG TPA: 3'-5' exonuclease [Clostridia bacterium]|nr:3'-5' exonuclease [Clostridia bacterium]